MRLMQAVLSFAPDMQEGDYAVVGLSWQSNEIGWNTGRTHATRQAAYGRQTREINANDCRAYVVHRHSGGTTVYLGPGHVLGTAQ